MIMNVLLDDTETATKDFDWLLQPKKSEPMVFKDDPVAQACASYRIWKNGGGRWTDLDDVAVKEEDRVESSNIRKYYADRIMMSMLTNQQISTFRKKLYGVVSNSAGLEKADVGLLHRLPYFYREDLAVDRVIEQTKALTCQYEPQRITAQFTLIERVLKSRRAGDYTQFWLRGSNSDAPYMMLVKVDNPYYRLITGVLSQPVTLSGWAHTKFHKGHHRGQAFFYLADVEIAQQ